MKRMRKTLPSVESQKPTPEVPSDEPSWEKNPVSEASINGFLTAGDATFHVISTKSKTATEAADCENTTGFGVSVNTGFASNNSKISDIRGPIGRVQGDLPASRSRLPETVASLVTNPLLPPIVLGLPYSP